MAEKSDYVKTKFGEFKEYLQKELGVLKAVKSYEIIYTYLEQFPGRIKTFIKDVSEISSSTLDRLPKEFRESLLTDREAYLKKAAALLEEESKAYSPLDGSVWEDVGNMLKQLSEDTMLLIKKGKDKQAG